MLKVIKMCQDVNPRFRSSTPFLNSMLCKMYSDSIEARMSMSQNRDLTSPEARRCYERNKCTTMQFLFLILLFCQVICLLTFISEIAVIDMMVKGTTALKK